MAINTMLNIKDGKPEFPYWNLIEGLNCIKDGDWFNVRLTKPGKPKSDKQLAWYYGAILTAAHYGMLQKGWDVDGVPICREMADAWLKRKCAGGELKRDMTAAEAVEFMEKCRMYVSSKFGIDIPDPDPEWRLKLNAEGGK